MNTAQRKQIALHMDYLVKNKGKVHYELIRPNPTAYINSSAKLIAAINSPRGITADCSGMQSLLMHVVGARPPSGPKYGWSYGNTGTMLTYLPHYSNPADAMIGGIVVFNADWAVDKQHTASVRHPGADPILFQFGTEPDPTYIRYSWLKAAFPGRAVMLSINRL